MRKRPAGFTLLETLIALLVTLATVAAIAAGMRALGQGTRGAQLGQEVLVLVDKVRQTYGHQTTYAGLTNARAITAMVVPTTLMQAGAIAIETGPITLSPIQLAVANDGIGVALSIPHEGCVEFLRAAEPRASLLEATDSGNVTRTVNKLTGNSNVPGHTATNNPAAITGAVTGAWIRRVCQRTNSADIPVVLGFP